MPLWATLAAGIVTVAWVLGIYFREVSPAGKSVRLALAGLRLTALVLVLTMLAQPVVERFRTGRPRLVVLLDRSASMDVCDAYPSEAVAQWPELAADDATRIEVGKTLLTGGERPLIDRLQSAYRLDIVAVDQQVSRIDAAGTTLAQRVRSLEVVGNQSDGTRLGDAVDYALRELPDSPPAAILALTDGITTRGRSLREAAERARTLRVPLYNVAVGSEHRRPDVAVDDLVVEDVVFPGDRLQVEATLRATGYAGRPAKVTLRDVSLNKELAQMAVALPADGETSTVRLTLQPTEAGRLSLQLGVEPIAGEANTHNNARQQVVEVRAEKIHVLLVQSSPSYEYRALKSLLERDPAVELRVRLQEADADFAAVDRSALRAFPISEEALFAYDVVLLGDVDPGLLPRSVWPRLLRFVSQHGGGLVCIAGPKFMPRAYRDIRPMRTLLPIDIEAINPLPSVGKQNEVYPIRPTALGWQTPSLQLGETAAASKAIWRGLPAVSWLLEMDRLKPGAQVLAENPTHTNSQGQPLPVILRHYVGAGEVLLHATDETWRWRWRTDDRYFARYWGQVVRRLGRGRLAAGRQGMKLDSDRTTYLPGEPVRLEVRFRNPGESPPDEQGVVVQLQGNVMPRREIRLQRRFGHRGVFETIVRDLSPGTYEVRLIRPDEADQAPETRFTMEEPPRELARVAVDRRALSEAAEISGGKFYTVATADRLASELPPPRAVTLQRWPDQKLWNSHALIALFVLVLAVEWTLRRRYGML